MIVKKSSLYIFLISVIANVVFMTSMLPSNVEIVCYAFYCCALVAVSLFVKKDALAPSNLFLYFYMTFLGFGMIILKVQNYSLQSNQLPMIVGGLTCFLYGSLLFENTKLANKKIKIRGLEIENINYNKLEKYSKIVFVVAFIAGVIYLLPNIGTILADFENNRITSQSGNGAKIYIMYLMIPSLFLMYNCHLRNRKIRFLWLYAVLAAVIFIMSGSRSRLIEIIVGFLLVRNSYKNLKPKTIIVAGIACVGLLSILALFRNIISGISTNIISKILNVLNVQDINIGYVLRTFPDKVDFQYGSTYFMNFLMLLPGSQQDFTLWLKDAVGISFSGGGLTPSIIGECYLNFDVVGVYVVMFILGILFSKIDKNMLSNKNCVPLVILTLYLCKAVTGGLSNIVIVLLWFEIVTVFTCFISRQRENYQLSIKGVPYVG